MEQSAAFILTGSLSPIYENNPSFRLVYIDDVTKSFIDYKQWYLNLAMANGMKMYVLSTFSKSVLSYIYCVQEINSVCSILLF